MSDTKILVVEDEEIVAFDLETTLNDLGYEVTAVVASGEEAIDQVQENTPDLVLMDIMLKTSMNGIQAADEIRKKLGLPIVYLTAHADLKTLEQTKNTQPFGYLLKPFEDRELFTTVEIALSRHEAETKINQAWHREKELNQLKESFITAAAHEFRTPLTSIRSSVDLLQLYSQSSLDAKQNRHFERINYLIEEMVDMLDELLLLSKIESNQLEFNPALVNVVRFCQDFLTDFQAKQRNWANLNLICNQFPIYGCLDENLLRIIMSNLLSNAIKYSPQSAPIDCSISSDNDQVNFKIQDQGIGIFTEDMDKVFESFYRGGNVGKVKGRGLGLSIAKNCVNLHGGQISIDSKVDQGTTCTVTLPLNYLDY